jgi:hypothetical protein
MFCQHCGNAVDQVAEVIAAEEREPVEVTLARIEADKAIAVARIEAGAIRAEAASAEVIAETEADAAVDAAEVQAEVIGAAIEGSDQPAPEPLQIIAPEFTNTVEAEAEDAPPEVEGSAPPEQPAKRGLGMW